MQLITSRSIVPSIKFDANFALAHGLDKTPIKRRAPVVLDREVEEDETPTLERPTAPWNEPTFD